MIAQNQEYASFGIRLLARIIDEIFLYVGLGFVLAVMILFTVGSPMASWIAGIFLAAWIATQFGYFIILHGFYGQTLGKKLVGIKVVDKNGNIIGLGPSLTRIVGEIICRLTLFIGYFLIAFDNKKQGLHDKIAHTYVVRVKEK